MKKKYYIFSGSIILILLVFLSLREFNGNYYKMSVKDAYAILIKTDINISAEELKETGSSVLKVHIVLGTSENEAFSEEDDQITVPAANLLDSRFLKRIGNDKGTIVIVSEDVELATHAWIILTRKGFENIKISDFSKDEKLNYTFQPETK